MIRIVLDANVIISAVFGGIPLEVVHGASNYKIFVNEAIERELLGVIDKLENKLPESLLKEAKNQIEIVIGTAKKVRSKKVIKICRDPKDNAYLEVAEAAHADILITGDKDLLSLTSKELKKIDLGKLKIITPRQFIEKFQDLK